MISFFPVKSPVRTAKGDYNNKKKSRCQYSGMRRLRMLYENLSAKRNYHPQWHPCAHQQGIMCWMRKMYEGMPGRHYLIGGD